MKNPVFIRLFYTLFTVFTENTKEKLKHGKTGILRKKSLMEIFVNCEQDFPFLME
jgi:hypothetical protein